MPDSKKRRFGPSVLVIAVALLGGVLLVPRLPAGVDAALALGAAAAVVGVLGALAAGLAWSRRRRGETTGDVTGDVAVAESPADAASELTFWPAETSDVPAETELDVLNEHASTRVLQLQVRTLASALEELQDLGLDDLRGTTVRDLIDNAALSQGRALVAVRALRDVLAAQPGPAATDRIEAALDRLGVEAWFQRPALTRRPGQVFVTFANPPAAAGVHEDDVVPAPPAAEPPVGDPGSDPGPDHVADAGADADLDAELDTAVTTPADSRRVLPVPAPAPAAAETRSRRRRGRTSSV
jgi:hypothetical protein